MNVCAMCGLEFASLGGFDTHRVGKHAYTLQGLEANPSVENGRRCRDSRELLEGDRGATSHGRRRMPGDPPWGLQPASGDDGDLVFTVAVIIDGVPALQGSKTRAVGAARGQPEHRAVAERRRRRRPPAGGRLAAAQPAAAADRDLQLPDRSRTTTLAGARAD